MLLFPAAAMWGLSVCLRGQGLKAALVEPGVGNRRVHWHPAQKCMQNRQGEEPILAPVTLMEAG